MWSFDYQNWPFYYSLAGLYERLRELSPKFMARVENERKEIS